MSEKEEVLRQISEIKSHLIDRETFFPYNYNACYVWSLIAMTLTLVMIPSYEYGIAFGTGVTFVFVAIGFIIEGVLTKRINQSYDIEECTKKQQFIMQNFLILALFSIVISMILASQQLYVMIFLSWLFLISMGYFTVGFILNIKNYARMAKFNITLSLLLLSIGDLLDLLEERGLFLRVVQIIVILGLTILPSIVAYKQQRVENEQKVCGV